MAGPGEATGGDTSAWLEQLGLGQYAGTFLAQKIDWEVLPDLTDAELQALGLPLGPRKKILKAIRTLPAPAPQAEPMLPRPPPRSGAERRNLTVMMCDMVDSTTLATRLDPEELRQIMHSYMDACTTVVATFGGYVARYQGDGLMAYFGYPQAREDAAERAVRTALRLIEAVRTVSADPTVRLQTRVGIATGLAVVGDLIGEGAAREEAVVGETPALAARLQSVAPPDGVVIADSTRGLLGRAFTLEDLGPQVLKGFGPKRIWRVTGEARAESRFAAARDRTGIMVGRDSDLAVLLTRWRLAAAGASQVVLLSGEPGLGKSRLVQALREALAGQPHEVILMQCASYNQASALRPVIEWIERAAGLSPGEKTESRRDKLARLPGLAGEALDTVAELMSAGSRTLAAQTEQAMRRERLLAAILPLLTATQSGTPRLLVLEDAHWGDASTLDLFLRIAAAPPGGPLMVLVTSRPDAGPPWLGEHSVTTITLDRLEPLAAARLVESMGGTQLLSAELRSRIVGRAGGVPLFVEELTKSVLEAEHTHAALAPWETLVRVPATLQDTLMARLDRLGEDRVIAQIGSVLGREFSDDLLAACAGMQRRRLRQGLARLMDAGLLLLREHAGTVYTFKHALIQDAAYLSLLRSERTRLHGVTARLLENRFGSIAAEQPELVAHHYTEAGETDIGIEWWQRAATRATARAASSEAAHHLETALALLQARPASAARDRREIALRSALAKALIIATGYGSPQTEANKNLLGVLLDQAAPSFEGAAVLYTEAAMLLMRSELGRVDAVAQRCVRTAEGSGVANSPMMGQRILGYAALVRGEIGTASGWFTTSFRGFDPSVSDLRTVATAAHAPVASMLAQDVLLLLQQGHVAAAAARGAEAVAEAQRTASPATLGYVLVHLGLAHIVTNDPAAGAAVLPVLAQTFSYCPWLSWHGDVHGGWVAAKEGALDAGLARIQYGLEQAAQMQSRLWWPLYTLCQAELLAEHGRYAEALGVLDRCERMIGELGQGYVLAELTRQRAVMRGAVGAPAGEVERGLEAALAIARQQGTRFYELRASISLARLWLREGRMAEAEARLAPVVAVFTGDPATSWAGGDLREAQALLAQLALAG